MTNYLVKISHDNGIFKLQVNADTKEIAIKKVMAAENCPKSAIINVIELTPQPFIEPMDIIFDQWCNENNI